MTIHFNLAAAATTFRSGAAKGVAAATLITGLGLGLGLGFAVPAVAQPVTQGGEVAGGPSADSGNESAPVKRFKPTMLSGQPIKVTGTVTVNHVLQ
jgi:hypothetical protein